MYPFKDYDLRKVIKRQWQAVQKSIDSLSNEEIMANDLEILADNFYQEFFIEPIVLYEEDFSKRTITQGKIKKCIDPFWRDFYGDTDYIEVDGIIGTFCFPYTGDKELFKCRASTYTLGGYPEIMIYKNHISFVVKRTLEEFKSLDAKERIIDGLNGCVGSIKKGIEYANNDVNEFNSSLRAKALKELEKKKNNVQSYYDIAKMFEVPIEKKEYSLKHIPLSRNIVPIAHKYEQEDYYGINDSDYRDILESIKHTASTYERTPASYKSMQEEDLRNTLLAALNATYKGNANGETFRKTGKTDICIELKNRAAFVAECKMWTGRAEISTAIKQLDSYLTWRDCKTALIFFVRRKNFIKVLDTAKEALKNLDDIRNVKEIDKNEFDCLYISDSNPGQQIQIRVMLFDLYS